MPVDLLLHSDHLSRRTCECTQEAIPETFNTKSVIAGYAERPSPSDRLDSPIELLRGREVGHSRERRRRARGLSTAKSSVVISSYSWRQATS